MKEINRNIANNIKNYMDVLGITQLDLAKRLECSNSTISMWIRGNSTPRIDKIDRMCEIFKCSRSDLLSDKIKTPEEIKNAQLLTVFVEKFENLEDSKKLHLLAYMDRIARFQETDQ